MRGQGLDPRWGCLGEWTRRSRFGPNAFLRQTVDQAGKSPSVTLCAVPSSAFPLTLCPLCSSMHFSLSPREACFHPRASVLAVPLSELVLCSPIFTWVNLSCPSCLSSKRMSSELSPRQHRWYNSPCTCQGAEHSGFAGRCAGYLLGIKCLPCARHC